MHASDNLNSRSWYSADSAEIAFFPDGARWTLKWLDGAFVYCFEDSHDEARQALRRYGFNA